MRHLFQFATAGKRNWTMNGAGAGLKLALWIVLSARSQAATWYVDSAATGAHNGTSWSNAWTSFSQISGVSAGDTVNISGGTSGSSETYSIGGSFPFVNGVNNSSRTVYQIGQDSAHDGTAILWSQALCLHKLRFDCESVEQWVGEQRADYLLHILGKQRRGVYFPQS
jgi:hypothetical protein